MMRPFSRSRSRTSWILNACPGACLMPRARFSKSMKSAISFSDDRPFGDGVDSAISEAHPHDALQLLIGQPELLAVVGDSGRLSPDLVRDQHRSRPDVHLVHRRRGGLGVVEVLADHDESADLGPRRIRPQKRSVLALHLA